MSMDDLKKKQINSEIDLTPIDEELDQEQLEKDEEADKAEDFEFTLKTRRDERNLALLFVVCYRSF
jgi:hypothetical protein